MKLQLTPDMVRIVLIVLIAASQAVAQTKTTQALDQKYEGLSLFFYRNTLRMLNQTDDPAFDDLIKDIEKMRFVMINRATEKFTESDYKNLLAGYKSEAYEEIMTGRADGRTFTVYVKENNGNVKGTVILAKDETSLLVLDMLGKIALTKVPEFFKTIDGSTDIGGKIKGFLSNGDEKNRNADTGNNH
ncbi:MAG: DUF4252 domain-containing protein [Cyclobacteriaceae bacterium]|nr:DUF4252 domain-containing protein [Cytophagales bacterium]MBX2901289.1 DUF4252 domain-containing protein [Cyclobacteriaceae bacterium]